MRAALVLAAFVATIIPRHAEAGRRRFGWSYDTETVPERGVEIEAWITEETGAEEWSGLRWLTVFGLTDTVELAIFADLVWREGMPPMTPPRTAFEQWGLEGRWRLASADPVEAGPLVPLVRLAAYRLVTDREAFEAQGSVVLSLDLPAGFDLVLDAGGEAHITSDDTRFEALVGSGVAWEPFADFRVGAEAFFRHAEGTSWVAVGPVISYTHGRLWLVASAPIGVTADAPDFLPRLLWAVAF